LSQLLPACEPPYQPSFFVDLPILVEILLQHPPDKKRRSSKVLKAVIKIRKSIIKKHVYLCLRLGIKVAFSLAILASLMLPPVHANAQKFRNPHFLGTFSHGIFFFRLPASVRLGCLEFFIYAVLRSMFLFCAFLQLVTLRASQ
jgi:hypothetical protein